MEWGYETVTCHAEIGDGIGLIDRTGVIVAPVTVDALPAEIHLVVPKRAHCPTLAWAIFSQDGEPQMRQYVPGPVFPGDNVNVHLPTVGTVGVVLAV